MRALLIGALTLLSGSAVLGCGSDDSVCEDLLVLCEGCVDPDLIAVCEARRDDRDQVRCSLALDDVRAECGADAGPTSRDARVVDALPMSQ